jgi:homoserine O-succinyltransferase
MGLLEPTSHPTAGRRRRIEIGLVNNIGDKALRATERQFETLVAGAAADFDLRFRIFALKETPRSPSAREYIAARYEPASAILRAELHALIFTGAQPQADRLDREPYWEELVELIEWAKVNTASTILSCLAAHAAVLYLDGVQRRPLPEKCTGVFAFTAKGNHALAGQKGGSILIPHSRYNGLLEHELDEAGYCILTGSPTRGVDTFTKSFGSQFVFLQGHPEYEASSLAREYRRDMEGYLRGETERKPPMPKGYFGVSAEAKLGAIERRQCASRDRMQIDDLSAIDRLAPSEAMWRPAAVSFYRNWIEMIANLVGYGRAPPPRLMSPEYASQRSG